MAAPAQQVVWRLLSAGVGLVWNMMKRLVPRVPQPFPEISELLIASVSLTMAGWGLFELATHQAVFTD